MIYITGVHMAILKEQPLFVILLIHLWMIQRFCAGWYSRRAYASGHFLPVWATHDETICFRKSPVPRPFTICFGRENYHSHRSNSQRLWAEEGTGNLMFPPKVFRSSTSGGRSFRLFLCKHLAIRTDGNSVFDVGDGVRTKSWASEGQSLRLLYCSLLKNASEPCKCMHRKNCQWEYACIATLKSVGYNTSRIRKEKLWVKHIAEITEWRIGILEKY